MKYKPLPNEYTVSGTTYKLVKREGLVAMYKSEDSGYEVFIVQQREEEWVGPKKHHMEARETPPLPSQWGSIAFSPSTEEQAEKRFELLKLRQVNSESSREVEQSNKKPVTSKKNGKKKPTA